MINENSTLAEVNEAVKNAKISTDNHLLEEHYTSELCDCGPETVLIPSGKQTPNDDIQPSKTVLTDLHKNTSQVDKMLIKFVRSSYY